MENEPMHKTGAEESVQATIGVKELDTPATEAAVTALVGALPGVKSVSVVDGKLHVIYNPLRIPETAIEEAIRRGGHQPVGGEAERDSPFAGT